MLWLSSADALLIAAQTLFCLLPLISLLVRRAGVPAPVHTTQLLAMSASLLAFALLVAMFILLEKPVSLFARPVERRTLHRSRPLPNHLCAGGSRHVQPQPHPARRGGCPNRTTCALLPTRGWWDEVSKLVFVRTVLVRKRDETQMQSLIASASLLGHLTGLGFAGCGAGALAFRRHAHHIRVARLRLSGPFRPRLRLSNDEQESTWRWLTVSSRSAGPSALLAFVLDAKSPPSQPLFLASSASEASEGSTSLLAAAHLVAATDGGGAGPATK